MTKHVEYWKTHFQNSFRKNKNKSRQPPSVFFSRINSLCIYFLNRNVYLSKNAHGIIIKKKCIYLSHDR